LDYSPDQRQAIAESWPCSIDDSAAKEDWGWQAEIMIEDMTNIMLDAMSTTNETLEP
jgi:nucleoside-diphosphate-sugar epimerase